MILSTFSRKDFLLKWALKRNARILLFFIFPIKNKFLVSLILNVSELFIKRIGSDVPDWCVEDKAFGIREKGFCGLHEFEPVAFFEVFGVQKDSGDFDLAAFGISAGD